MEDDMEIPLKTKQNKTWDKPPYDTAIPLLAIYPAATAAKSLQSCPTLSDTMDCSPSGSSIHEIFQARVLE